MTACTRALLACTFALILLPGAHAQTRKSFGPWAVVCSGGATGYCSASNRVKSVAGPYRFQLNVTRERPGAVFELALLTGYQHPGAASVVVVQVDAGKPVRLSPPEGYRRAGRTNTYVVAPRETERLLKQMRGAKRLRFRFEDAKGAAVDAGFTLAGLGGAMGFMDKMQPAPQRRVPAPSAKQPAVNVAKPAQGSEALGAKSAPPAKEPAPARAPVPAPTQKETAAASAPTAAPASGAQQTTAAPTPLAQEVAPAPPTAPVPPAKQAVAPLKESSTAPVPLAKQAPATPAPPLKEGSVPPTAAPAPLAKQAPPALTPPAKETGPASTAASAPLAKQAPPALTPPAKETGPASTAASAPLAKQAPPALTPPAKELGPAPTTAPAPLAKQAPPALTPPAKELGPAPTTAPGPLAKQAPPALTPPAKELGPAPTTAPAPLAKQAAPTATPAPTATDAPPTSAATPLAETKAKSASPQAAEAALAPAPAQRPVSEPKRKPAQAQKQVASVAAPTASRKRGAKSIRQFSCRGNEPSWTFVIDGESARYSSLTDSGQPDSVELTGKLSVTGDGPTPIVNWRGKSDWGGDFRAVVAEERCRDSMSDAEGQTGFEYRGQVTLPGGKTVRGCCNAGLPPVAAAAPTDTTQYPIADLRTRPETDWSRYLFDLLPAIQACIDKTPEPEPYATKAWPMNRGMVGVRTRNGQGGWFECVAEANGKSIERFVPLPASAPPAPNEDRVVFSPPDHPPPAASCYKHERVMDGMGDFMGWLSTNGCS